MKIGELAQKVGLRPSAIRYYESVGVLPRASRQSGQRLFDVETERYLRVIEFARKAGFTVAEIKLLFHGFKENAPASHRWKTLARMKIRDMDLLMKRLGTMRRLLKNSMSCRCIKLQDCGRILLSSYQRVPQTRRVKSRREVQR
jgi:MerR family transcriptional regulator, redox-sensitive transcriptional activator SoxR